MRVFCWSTFPGSPKGLPKGHLRKSARGGRMVSRYMRVSPKATVAMPCFSIARAISPTDCVHVGQQGVRSAISAPSSLSLRATSGA